MRPNVWVLMFGGVLIAFFGSFLFGIVRTGEEKGIAEERATSAISTNRSVSLDAPTDESREQGHRITPIQGVSLIGEQAVFVLRSPDAPPGVTIECPNRSFLQGYLVARTELLTPMLPLLRVEQPCGQRMSFNTIADLPDKSVICPCGKKGCVVIRYTGEPA